MLYILVNGIFIDNFVKDIDGKYDYNEYFLKQGQLFWVLIIFFKSVELYLKFKKERKER